MAASPAPEPAAEVKMLSSKNVPATDPDASAASVAPLPKMPAVPRPVMFVIPVEAMSPPPVLTNV